jgi:hypothetical protein
MTVPSWVWGGGGALVLSAAARALPAPLPCDNRLYLWFYTFAGYLLANFDKTAAAPSLDETCSPKMPPFAPGTEEKK